MAGIHPRLHFWPRNAPECIPDIGELRRRAQSGNPMVRWLCAQLIADADREAAAPPLIATPMGPKAIGIISGGGMGITRCWLLGIAWHLTGDDKYYQAAKRQAFAIADEWCDWVDPYHAEMGIVGDLRTGSTLEALALIYDWFYHEFTPAERRHLCEVAERRGFSRIREELRRDSWAVNNIRSNWMAVVVGGAGYCAMAMLDECEALRDIAEIAADRVPRMIEGFGADGGWEEGAGYWGGTYILIHYLDALRTATGGAINHLHDQRLRKTCWFPLYFALPPDGMTDFADSSYAWGLTPTAFAAMAAVNHDPFLQWAALEAITRERRGYRVNPAKAWPQLLIFFDPALEPEAPDSSFPLAMVFQDVGWAAIRNGWGDDDLKALIAVKAGNNQHGGNQHLDVGNVITNAFGQRMLVDHGYGNGIPSWTHASQPGQDEYFRWGDPLYSTPGHNVVVIGGKNQKLDGTGAIMFFWNDDKVGTIIAIDCTGAYDGVRKAVRHIIHLRPDLLIVRDEFELEQPAQAWLSWHLPAVALADDFKEDGDVTSYLTGITNGCCFREAKNGRMQGTVTVPTDPQAVFTSGAHRRIAMKDRYGAPMPNTIYPYVRATAAPSTRHVFVSSFTFIPI